ncbi:hypothetical protein F5Y17DRAFT_413128 [Xylariaceae sp. FL0594]|nr:hypothetical protein F5Y17DRAFT_413128 [Xylariaceae sp. FL0594]
MKDFSTEDTKGLLFSRESSSWSESESLPTSTPPFSRGRATTLSQKWQRRFPVISVVLAVTNIITLGALFVLLLAFRQQAHEPQIRCVNHPPKGITPTLTHLAETSPQLVDVTFYPDGSPWRKHNSTEADEIWADHEQANRGFVMIPKEEAEAADIDPSRHAYIDRPDIGMVGYPVLPEAVHQMHCVNMLRKNLYYNIEHTRSACKPPLCVPHELEGWDIWHIDHCLEIIRNRIACTADMGVVPFLWVGDKDKAKLTGENKRMHTCGNYDAIRQFVAVNAVREPPKGTSLSLRPSEDAFVAGDYDE